MESTPAAGQGLEPQLPEPESGVLPLDDPAGIGRDGSNPSSATDPPSRRAGSGVELVDRDEALLVLGVDVSDHLDVRLEPRAAQLRLEEAVDLVEPRGIV